MECGGDVFGGADLFGVAFLSNAINDSLLDLCQIVLDSLEQRKLLIQHNGQWKDLRLFVR